MKRRGLVCLLLALMMLPVSVLAVNSGAGVLGGGTLTDGKGLVYASGRQVGLALGIQIMNDPKYTVYPEDKEPEHWIDGAEINNKGLANVCNHFMYSYPNPYETDVFYLLPDTVYVYGTPKYRTVTNEGKIAYAEIGNAYATKSMRTPSSDKGRTLAKDIYDTIQEDKATEDYFKGLINKVTYKEALSYISYIFGVETTYSGYATPDVSEINKRWQEEYDYGTVSLTEDTDKTKRKLANYVAILTCLSKLLSESNYYSGQIATFAMNALKGEAYSPIIITAETCINYRIADDGKFYFWRTSTEHLALQAGVAESSIRNADGTVLNVNGLNGYSNMTLAILNAACKQSNYNGSSYGCAGFLNTTNEGKIYSDGKGWGRGMVSLSTDAINCLAEDWGYTIPGGSASTAALWGCGIFGGTEALTVAPQRQHLRDGKNVF